jgi:Zn-dependent protease/CBS domain-containing protein
MKWSLRIARVSGIDIKVHASFLLVVVYFAAMFGSPHGLLGAAFGTAVVLTLFACVVLHELGHSLVAQRFGVSVREIILLPIGGLARLGREPSRPFDELVIAVAGPLVNVVIAVALMGVAIALYGPSMLFSRQFFDSALGPPSFTGLLSSLLWANVALAVFNMIPALPMDGGRVFRALLAMVVGKPKATRIAATVGQLLAAGLAVIGIYVGNLILALIAAFVFLGASQERVNSQVTEAVRGLSAGEVCDPNAITLVPGDMVGSAVDHLLRTPQGHFAVVHGDHLVGTLSRDEVLAAAGAVGLGAFVAGVMRRDVVQIDAGVPLDELRHMFMELGGRPVAVFGPHGFMGLLGYEDVSRIASLAAALERRGVVRPAVARPDVPTI